MNNPTPPTDVRLILHDGNEIAVECRYEGLDDRGLHRWTAVTPSLIPLHLVRSIAAAEVPARTSIAIGVTL